MTAKMPLASEILVTGGAGFIGANLADRLASSGSRVTIYDNLSRPGVEENAEWLTAKHPHRVRIIEGDIRDASRLADALAGVDQVFHLAAQVAVTTSICDPRYDFDVNLGGTMNLLEGMRGQARPPSLLFTSTNKVYGALTDLCLERKGQRYEPAEHQSCLGICEGRGLDFHSPYGCSKGAADQYVLDYCRTYGLSAVVFRMSCIYGPRQMGTEDQGWIAHFLMKALNGKAITIYGDGCQVRDVLFVDDLIEALVLAQAGMSHLRGEAFNIGGGHSHTLSLIELIDLIDSLQGVSVSKRMEGWRLGDQRYYVSNTSKFQAATGWLPRVGVTEGVSRLYAWLKERLQESDTGMLAGDERALLTH